MGQYANILSMFSGLNNTATDSTSAGGGLTGALGGATGLAQLLAALGIK